MQKPQEVHDASMLPRIVAPNPSQLSLVEFLFQNDENSIEKASFVQVTTMHA